MTEEEEEYIARKYNEAAGPGEPLWRIIAKEARVALARGDTVFAEELLEKAERMKAIEARLIEARVDTKGATKL